MSLTNKHLINVLASPSGHAGVSINYKLMLEELTGS